MPSCDCPTPHATKRIVLTGGPGAGKTAVLELMRKTLCPHVKIVPESAGIVFGGGFPRGDSVAVRCASQRAIFHVQRELEAALAGEDLAIALCDRGTIDGLAYWPVAADFFGEVGTSQAAELARYDAVIHLRTPDGDRGYNHQNPLRLETAAEAAAIDKRIAQAWRDHPHRFEVPPHDDFLAKAARVIELVRAELPACCRDHPVAALGETR